ncbi:hypothetical protein [Rubrobacter calidifluminis]|uniref:hypothetical protein n=1 Tax=Rubrobacter calidifluminis TaxID=1392640 RepID=UPI002362FC74|nr:hypothetical protein [Rubrobacter calidifluminis]
MSPNDAASLLVGPAGALVVLAAVLLGMTRFHFLVPYFVYESERKRNDALEEENEKLNQTVLELTENVAKYREEIARQGARIEALTSQVEELKEELQELRGAAGHES